MIPALQHYGVADWLQPQQGDGAYLSDASSSTFASKHGGLRCAEELPQQQKCTLADTPAQVTACIMLQFNTLRFRMTTGD